MPPKLSGKYTKYQGVIMTTQSSALSVFNFKSNAVRVIADEKGEPWFLANDVCNVLGYANPRDAIAKHCRAGGVAKRDTPTECDVAKRDASSRARESQEMTYINEGNLYRLIIKSRKPEAEPFESWVCDEVLPSIRKTGKYELPTPPQNPRLLLRNTIHAIAKGDRQTYSNLYNRLYRKFQVTSYKELNDKQCVAAVEFIKSLEGEYIPRDKIEAPKPSLALCDGQHYVVAKDGVVLMHKVLSHDINDSFLKSLAQPTLDLQSLELLQGEIDYWQVRKALALVNGLVGQYQPYSHVRPMVNVLEATENMLRRLWTMIDESSTKVGILQAVAKTGKPLNEANMDTLAHIQALLHSKMMRLQMPNY